MADELRGIGSAVEPTAIAADTTGEPREVVLQTAVTKPRDAPLEGAPAAVAASPAVAPLAVIDPAGVRLQVALAVARACVVIAERCEASRRPESSALPSADIADVLALSPNLPDTVGVAVRRAREVVAAARPSPPGIALLPTTSQPTTGPSRMAPATADEQTWAVRCAMAAMRARAPLFVTMPGPAASHATPMATQASELPSVLVLADLLTTVGRAQLRPAALAPQPAPPPRPLAAPPPVIPISVEAQVSPLVDIPKNPSPTARADLPPSAIRVGRARAYRAPPSEGASAVLPPPSRTAAAPSAHVVPLSVPDRADPMAGPDRLRSASPWRRLLATISGGALVVLRLAIITSLVAAIFWSLALLAYRQFDPPFSTLMLGQYLTGRPVEQRWVPLQRISPNLVRAVIASEDGNFCRHRGVDWGAINEAMGQAAEEGGRPRGASTISMQTVKNLLLWPQSHYLRKILELPLAYLAEMAWGKRRILELYLNIAEWGPGIFGIEAAAQYHFRKSAASLNVREAALLAVSLPNPIERIASAPGPGMQRLGQLIERRAARPTLPLGCLGLSKQVSLVGR